MLNTLSLLTTGFSIIGSLLLFVIYVGFLRTVEKTWLSIASCAVMMLGLVGLQWGHWQFLRIGNEPFESTFYIVCLVSIPPNYYIFCRAVLFPDKPVNLWLVLHLVPIPILLVLPAGITIPATFLFGMSYCFWLANLIYGLREQRKQFGAEFFFFTLFLATAIIVLFLGLSLPYIDTAYFYYFYSNSIGVVIILVIAALILFPDILLDLTQAVTTKYATTTLGGVEVPVKLAEVQKVLEQDKLYQNEELSLGVLAEAVDLSTHQLSELINVHFGMSFSKYIRQLRIEAAKHLLLSQPQASILAISMETGFRSQSNFYAAFKEVTGEAPGNFRKKQP